MNPDCDAGPGQLDSAANSARICTQPAETGFGLLHTASVLFVLRQPIGVFTWMTLSLNCDAMPGMDQTLSIGCHVKFDTRASKF